MRPRASSDAGFGMSANEGADEGRESDASGIVFDEDDEDSVGDTQTKEAAAKIEADADADEDDDEDDEVSDEEGDDGCTGGSCGVATCEARRSLAFLHARGFKEYRDSVLGHRAALQAALRATIDTSQKPLR
jgi:hypothetical protein